MVPHVGIYARTLFEIRSCECLVNGGQAAELEGSIEVDSESARNPALNCYLASAKQSF